MNKEAELQKENAELREAWLKLADRVVELETELAAMREQKPVGRIAGQVAAKVVHTDCRSDEGVTVGLIDTIINSARLLKGRAVTPAVMSAVEDLLQDEDLRSLLATSQKNKP